MPYTCSFKTDGDFGLWTVIDANNDYYTWERETTLAAAKYYANEDYETSADDWLISSPIALNAGVQYRLRFNAKSSHTPNTWQCISVRARQWRL